MINLKKLTGIFITFWLIALSGFPIFVGEISYIVSFILLLAYVLYNKINPLRSKFAKLVILFLLVAFAQFITFGGYNFYGFTGYLIKIGIAFLAVLALREQIIFDYVKVLKFLSIISLIIFIPCYFNKTIAQLLYFFAQSSLPVAKSHFGHQIKEGSLVLYHFNRHFLNSLRNSGPFWEPTAFGGYIILGVIFNTLSNKKLLDRTNILFLITIITTFSTTAYITVFVFLVGYSVIKSKKAYYLLFAIVGVFVITILYQQIPFLQKKIDYQFSSYKEAAYQGGGDTRFGSAYLDLIEFADSPIYGRGIAENRKTFKSNFARRNNGLTGFLNSWGIVIFIIYWFYVFRGFTHIGKQQLLALLGLLSFATINFSEVFFNYPVFWMLGFLGLVNLNFNNFHEKSTYQ